MTKSNEQLRLSLQSIRLVVFDVDGVMTNGELHYTVEGETLKVFHVRDGVGFKILQDMGIHVAVVTAKQSAMVARRMQDLGVKHYFPGTADKLTCLQQLATELTVTSDETAFVGDDMVDLAAMGWSALGIAPEDAYSEVLKQADWVVPVAGGKGVVRYIADSLLTAQGQFEKAYDLAVKPEFERDR